MNNLKTLLTLILVVFCFALSAQSKKQVERANYYADAVAKEFSLDKEQRTKVFETRVAALAESSKLGKKVKAGEITAEERKAKAKEIFQDDKELLSEVSGKRPKELREFTERLRLELKEL